MTKKNHFFFIEIFSFKNLNSFKKLTNSGLQAIAKSLRSLKRLNDVKIAIQ